MRTELDNAVTFIADCVFGRAGTDAMQEAETATHENPRCSDSEVADRLLELM